MSSYPPFYAYPSAPVVVRAVPNPPRLHWGWVFVLTLITFGVFASVWLIVQANWVRKALGRSKALPWTIVYASVLPALYLFAFTFGFVGTLLHVQNVREIVVIASQWVRVALFVLFIAATFTLRIELSEDPINIPLSGPMTFFFGAIYFQYHLFDYQVPDEVHNFRGPLRTNLKAPQETSTSQA